MEAEWLGLKKALLWGTSSTDSEKTGCATMLAVRVSLGCNFQDNYLDGFTEQQEMTSDLATNGCQGQEGPVRISGRKAGVPVETGALRRQQEMWSPRCVLL